MNRTPAVSSTQSIALRAPRGAHRFGFSGFPEASKRAAKPRTEGLTGIDADAGLARHLQCSRRLRLRSHHGQFERDAFSCCLRPLQGSIPINPATAKRPTDGGAFLSSEGLTGIEPA